MNEPRGRRFSKYQDGVPVKDFVLAVTEERFKAVIQSIENIKEAITEARRITERIMLGFPDEYAKRADMAATASILKELKDKDLRELKDLIESRMSRNEYSQEHRALQEKMDSSYVNIQDKIDYNSKRINGLENERANIQGRIIATGATVGVIVSIIMVAAQVVIHVYMGK